MRSERGQGTVEWVGLVLLVSVAMLGLVAAGARVPGAPLARALADRILCAASLADGCGDEPALIAAYGSDVGRLVRQQMPAFTFEQGSRAVPVDFRRCRSSECGDASGEGLVDQTDQGLPVTAFVHVIDCREGAAEETEAGADCTGDRAGNLYVQYWTYYADSATLRGVPVAGAKGYHADDWESVQFRIGPDGSVDQRASSHHGYNYKRNSGNWASDAGVASHDGWGEATHLLLVSGGSHAGNAFAFAEIDRFTPSSRVHLVPLEPIAAEGGFEFAVSAPWLKKVWLDPEARGTD
ncbi:MAG: hypothetical protein E6G51_09690 [Actinobacteria bacterium]|nr:MAG: hypothetical protein E6G51_09690 [Actinomycetota bacterium]